MHGSSTNPEYRKHDPKSIYDTINTGKATHLFITHIWTDLYTKFVYKSKRIRNSPIPSDTKDVLMYRSVSNMIRITCFTCLSITLIIVMCCIFSKVWEIICQPSNLDLYQKAKYNVLVFSWTCTRPRLVDNVRGIIFFLAD